MMKETIDLFGKILTNILTVLYEPFGFSLLLSFLAMFFYLYAYEPTAAGKGWKSAIVTWYQKFKESVFFRKMFLLVFVTSMILFRTLLNRNLWLNPLSNVMGGWGIWETVNSEQKLTTECVENEAVHAMLAVLTDKQRDLIHQQFVLGKTHQEIADDMGISRGSVTRAINQALERIRRKFDFEAHYELAAGGLA